MQTLTIPASVSKRKQACKSCRQRKKRCDAEHPSCSLCRKLNLRCDYAVTASTRDDGTSSTSRTEHHVSASPARTQGFDTMPFESPDFMQFSGMNFDLPRSTITEPVAPSSHYPTPGSTAEHSASTLDLDILESLQLPPRHVILQLGELFFEHLYHMFPCFHKKSFLAKVECGDMEKDAPLLLYAMCCVTARYHPDASIRKRSKDWLYYSLCSTLGLLATTLLAGSSWGKPGGRLSCSA